MRPMLIDSTESARIRRLRTAVQDTTLVSLAVGGAGTITALCTVQHCTCVVLGAVLLRKNTASLVLAVEYFALVAVAISCDVGLGHCLGTSVAVGVYVAGV
jgi:hypothetical protein